MSFTEEIPAHTIDLRKPEADRWADVIRKEKRAAIQLIKKIGEADQTSEWWRPFRDAIVGKAYELAGGLYQEELASWGEGLGISTGTMTALNCNYEASHMMCSAAVVNTARGPIHIRAMDWDLSGLGSATRKFWFKNGSRKFLAIGVLGHVGVVSGMLPGRYSITLNWAPSTAIVDPRDFGPTFLLRNVFETCDTYEQAIYHLRRTHLATSAFFVICGNKANQGCVIERTKKSSSLREMENGVIVQTNHFMTSRMRKFNDNIDDEDGILEDSINRQKCLENTASHLPRSVSLDSAAMCLDEDPVCNATTHQQMVFSPATGKHRSWRWVSR